MLFVKGVCPGAERGAPGEGKNEVVDHLEPHQLFLKLCQWPGAISVGPPKNATQPPEPIIIQPGLSVCCCFCCVCLVGW